jgi:phage tail-like protein
MSQVVPAPERASSLARTADATGMRAAVEGLESPKPFSRELPSLLQEDDFCVRLTQAFDDVIAPVYATLDCVDSYFDPDLAPADFLDWLATWVGVEIDEHWDVSARRALLHRMSDLYRIRGTVEGLSTHIEMYSGVVPEILENGGSMWSQTAESPLPGSAGPHLTVRLRVADPSSVNLRTLERIVETSRPAHLTFTVEILTQAGAVADSSDAPDDADGASQGDRVPGAVDLPGSERVDLAPRGPESAEPSDEEDVEGPEASGGKEPAE